MDEEALFVNYKQIVSMLLTCRRCNQQYKDPVYLPCRHLVCRKCIPQIPEVTCLECGSIHPSKNLEEYQSSLIADQLLKLQPFKVTRGVDFQAKIQDVKHRATNLIKNFEGAECELNKAESKIADHFGKIKTQIDLSTEKKIEELQKARDEILTELNDYEQKCTARLGGIPRLYLFTFDEYKKKCHDLIEMVEKPDCAEADVITSLEEITQMEKSVQEWKKELESENLFCGQSINFIENNSSIPQNMIGKLSGGFQEPEYAPLSIPVYKICHF